MYNSKTVTPHKANLHYLKPLLGREELWVIEPCIISTCYAMNSTFYGNIECATVSIFFEESKNF